MKCQKKNHFARRCRSNKVAAVEAEEMDETIINSIRSTKGVQAVLMINGKKVRFQLDTGASVNLLPGKYVSELNLVADRRKLTMWNGVETSSLGTVETEAMDPRDGNRWNIEFVVVKEDLKPILG